MKNVFNTLVILMVSFLLSACGSEKLSCNDTEAKVKALEVIHSYTDSVGGFDKRIQPYLGKRYISNISTTEANKELGNYSCTGTYNYEFKGKTRQVPITYSLRYLEDQKTSEARVSTEKVRVDYFLADAGA